VPPARFSIRPTTILRSMDSRAGPLVNWQMPSQLALRKQGTLLGEENC
jgi:hypothetical protein